MIPEKISNHILTIGCNFHPPKGGIAQVLDNYNRLIFPKLKFIANSRRSNKYNNFFILIRALFVFIYKLLFDRKIRIVHIHSSSYMSFVRSSLFVRIAKFFSKKVVLHIHAGNFRTYYNEKSKFANKIMKKCDCIVGLTPQWKSFFVDVVGCKNVEVIYNVVDEPKSFNSAVINDEVITFFYMGLIAKQKGVFDLIDVITQHKAELNGKFKLILAGNGNTDELNLMIKEQDLSQLVEYIGWVSGDEKEQFIQNCDVFILPSYYEGLPLSILEAMTYSKPIVATNVGGIPEFVDNENGVLFEPGDKDLLFEAICKYVDNKQIIAKQGIISKNRSKVAMPEYVANQLEKMYISLL